MPKRGQNSEKNKSRGNNNPSQSQTITTGTYKKKETYAEQAAEHKDPHKQPQAAKNEWQEDAQDLHDGAAHHRRASRSGSDSNASPGTRGH